MAVRNYAPELLALFKTAAHSTVRIPLDAHSTATAYRHRLHNLRKAMRNENHPLLLVAEGVSFSIEGEGDTTVLIARPADTKLVDALKRAGIEVGDPEEYVTPLPPPEAPYAPPAAHAHDAMSALAMFKKSAEKKEKPETKEKPDDEKT